MAILKQKNFGRKVDMVTTQATPVSTLEAGIQQGREVRDFLSGLVTKLDDANSLHAMVIAVADEKIEAANRDKNIAKQESAENAALADNLRKSLGLV